MTQYEFDRQALISFPDLNINNCTEDITNFLHSCVDDYYMLMNKNIDNTVYATIFEYSAIGTVKEMAHAIVNIVSEFGALKDIRVRNDHIEFWIKRDEDELCTMYVLFPYGNGVIKV